MATDEEGSSGSPSEDDGMSDDDEMPELAGEEYSEASGDEKVPKMEIVHTLASRIK